MFPAIFSWISVCFMELKITPYVRIVKYKKPNIDKIVNQGTISHILSAAKPPTTAPIKEKIMVILSTKLKCFNMKMKSTFDNRSQNDI